jgi:hypothetical protein
MKENMRSAYDATRDEAPDALRTGLRTGQAPALPLGHYPGGNQARASGPPICERGEVATCAVSAAVCDVREGGGG